MYEEEGEQQNQDANRDLANEQDYEEEDEKALLEDQLESTEYARSLYFENQQPENDEPSLNCLVPWSREYLCSYEPEILRKLEGFLPSDLIALVAKYHDFEIFDSSLSARFIRFSSPVPDLDLKPLLSEHQQLNSLRFGDLLWHEPTGTYYFVTEDKTLVPGIDYYGYRENVVVPTRIAQHLKNISVKYAKLEAVNIVSGYVFRYDDEWIQSKFGKNLPPEWTFAKTDEFLFSFHHSFQDVHPNVSEKQRNAIHTFPLYEALLTRDNLFKFYQSTLFPRLAFDVVVSCERKASKWEMNGPCFIVPLKNLPVTWSFNANGGSSGGGSQKEVYSESCNYYYSVPEGDKDLFLEMMKKYKELPEGTEKDLAYLREYYPKYEVEIQLALIEDSMYYGSVWDL